ncbi:hypothetical protein [Psychroserpens algicola]|uniref:Uncharacterized protein n=1 Tax=Psychroserpens algicola TaxID=1719034 RepID=A0ABT0HD02_9FLAO|nr:hypothetical protein [Psychroserpens algicola]MCK8482256.1 hypothetical protein [Psychroserpens algicola]
MTIFPERIYFINLENDSSKTLVDLQKETLSDQQFIVEWNKLFIGEVNQNGFEIKLARKWPGSFCIIIGKLENKNGILEIHISKVYKLLFGILVLFVLSGLIISLIQSEFETALKIILFIIILRFVFIELHFRINSKNSMNKLTKTIGINKLKKTRHNNVYN